uniref:Farnesyl pyrophosphate synthase n=1 Tax=Panagrolaimus sp. ES5 TaxID=591445 RepID=A0AC34G6Q1_9BILA
MKEEYVKSVYKKFGTNEKEFLEKRFSQFFEHSVFGGKMTRSQLSFSVFKLLQQNSSSSLEVDSKSALKVILSIELLQAVFLVIDDVMDGAETRRGKPCWYKMPSVGMAALNHALRLQNFVNISILNAIPTHRNLGDILKVVWETVEVTCDGQELDGFSSKASDCTFERYSHIVANKTSRYTFYHPITVAFLLAGENKHFDQILELSDELGYFFQAQDDLLDFKDNDAVTGKTCRDIQEGKCTWFSCKTMEKLAHDVEKKRQFE